MRHAVHRRAVFRRFREVQHGNLAGTGVAYLLGIATIVLTLRDTALRGRIVVGIIFVLAGCVLPKLRFRFSAAPIPILGALFILYALALYPLIGKMFGHHYPQCPVFGVAPCPATIYTFGILLWASRPVPLYVIVIPFLWSLVGVSAAVSLHVPQDYGLGIAGILGSVLVILRNRQLQREAQQTHTEATL